MYSLEYSGEGGEVPKSGTVDTSDPARKQSGLDNGAGP